jgi:hypothetical protein
MLRISKGNGNAPGRTRKTRMPLIIGPTGNKILTFPRTPRTTHVLSAPSTNSGPFAQPSGASSSTAATIQEFSQLSIGGGHTNHRTSSQGRGSIYRHQPSTHRSTQPSETLGNCHDYPGPSWSKNAKVNTEDTILIHSMPLHRGSHRRLRLSHPTLDAHTRGPEDMAISQKVARREL